MVIEAAADARGGKARLQQIRTLRIQGHGQLAYWNGVGNITGELDAPQKWINLNGYDRGGSISCLGVPGPVHADCVATAGAGRSSRTGRR
jgi:hypothetical protein